MQYNLKPYSVDAMQWDGTNLAAIASWLHLNVSEDPGDGSLIIYLPVKNLNVPLTYYIVQDSFASVHKTEQALFESLFELA